MQLLLKALEAAARASAKRLKMDAKASEALVQRYTGYVREMSGPGVKPVPAFLSIHGADDDTVSYEHGKKVLPMFAAMKPAPKVDVVLLEAGVHRWAFKEPDLPQGVAPTVTTLWNEAITKGYFLK